MGQTWRAARVPIATVGGLLIALALVGLAVFYAITRHDDGRSQAAASAIIERFTPADRMAHWLLAIVWVDARDHRAHPVARQVGAAAAHRLHAVLVARGAGEEPAQLHRTDPDRRGAVAVHPLRPRQRHRRRGHQVVPQHHAAISRGTSTRRGKFNAGEKLVFWLVLVLFSTVLVVTGLILVFPNFDQTRSTMQLSNIVHMVAAYVAIALACVHIYLGTIGMTGAYRAMRDGYVDASWAEHHHSRWYEEVVAGKAREKFVEPAAPRAPPEAAARAARLTDEIYSSGERPMTTLRALLAAGLVVVSVRRRGGQAAAAAADDRRAEGGGRGEEGEGRRCGRGSPRRSRRRPRTASPPATSPSRRPRARSSRRRWRRRLPPPPQRPPRPRRSRTAIRAAANSARTRYNSRFAERWPSGRRRLTRNQVYVYAYLGFESLSLRHDFFPQQAVGIR